MKVQAVVRTNMAKLALWMMPCLLLLVGVTKTESSDERTRTAIVHPLANANFKISGDPSCLSTAVEVGDPSTGPATILLKATKGCVVRWHFHTAEEQIMVVKGEFKVEMISMPAAVLVPGGFTLIPSKEKHQFTCTHRSECLLFLTIDRPFDSTWVTLGN